MLARVTDRHSVTAQGPAADSRTVQRNVTVRDGPTFNLKFKLASAAPVRAGHGVAAARLTLRHGRGHSSGPAWAPWQARA